MYIILAVVIRSLCVEATLDLDYLTTTGVNVPTSVFNDPNNNVDFIDWILNVTTLSNPPLGNNTYTQIFLSSVTSPIVVISISYGTYEALVDDSVIEAFDIAALKLSIQGVTIVVASGDDGITGSLFRSRLPLDGCGYYAMFPASSFYVTTVGATQGGSDVQNSHRSEEIACSSKTGGQITSGGGFSGVVPAPTFQLPFISSYFNHFNTTNIPTQSTYRGYDASKRGYPDVSLVALKYGTVFCCLQ